MNTRKNGGEALTIILLIAALLGGGSWYELNRASEKNTQKATKDTITQTQAAAQTSAAVAAANATSDAANSKLKAENDKLKEDIAGSADGAKVALGADPNPSVESKVAELMVDDILALSGPPTTPNETRYRKIALDLIAANRSLATENANLKDVNLTTTKAFDALKVEHAGVKADLTVAQQVAIQASAAKDDVVKKNTIAIGVAAASAKQIDVVNISWTERVKAWVLGLGLGGVAIGLLILVAFPILAQAYPAFAPIAKSLTGFVLGLWHSLADKAVSEAKTLATAAETKLAAEVAAHTSTKAALASSQAQTVTVAITPTVADNLIASMATPAMKAATIVAPSHVTLPSNVTVTSVS